MLKCELEQFGQIFPEQIHFDEALRESKTVVENGPLASLFSLVIQRALQYEDAVEALLVVTVAPY